MLAILFAHLAFLLNLFNKGNSYLSIYFVIFGGCCFMLDFLSHIHNAPTIFKHSRYVYLEYFLFIFCKDLWKIFNLFYSCKL